MAHRLLSYLSFNALATVAQWLARSRLDVVLCPNGSFVSGISVFLGSGPRRIPFVYNVQDLYPEVPVRAGQLTNKRAIAILERMECFMYRTAAHVTVIAPSHSANLLAKGVPAKKVGLIPNFVDTEFIRPLPRAKPSVIGPLNPEPLLKQPFDILVALTGLLLSSPLWVAIARPSSWKTAARSSTPSRAGGGAACRSRRTNSSP